MTREQIERCMLAWANSIATIADENAAGYANVSGDVALRMFAGVIRRFNAGKIADLDFGEADNSKGMQ